jgi:hypothetical protein
MPGRGMSFILYVVVLVVSLSSVMMGLDWLSTPPPPIPKSVQTVSAPATPKATNKLANKTASKAVAAAKTAGAKTTETKTAANKPAPKSAVATTGAASPSAAAQAIAKADAAPQPDAAAAQPDTADNQGAGASDNTLGIIAKAEEGGTDAQANAAPRCDVQACAAHYRSFDPTDCTYQPYDGPRRLCTLGNPPQQANDAATGVETSDASEPQASASCNVQACAAAYRSFDPATCTYQPYEGPRRACTK